MRSFVQPLVLRGLGNDKERSSRLHLGWTSAASRPYLGYTSTVSRLSLEVPASAHEAAAYASLASDASLLHAVLPVCGGWEDEVWARLKPSVGKHIAEQQRRLSEI